MLIGSIIRIVIKLFITFHFREAAANTLTNDALDPHAKIPEYKICAVSVCAADS